MVTELESWMREERAKLSKHAAVAKAFDYMLKRWDGFARFLEDGRSCLTNNAAERGGDRAAVMYSLIVTAKMNGVDPQAWLADVLAETPNTCAAARVEWPCST